MQVLADLKRVCLFGCCAEPARRAIGLMPVARFFCCLKQDCQDIQDFQDERGLGAAQRLWISGRTSLGP